MARKEDLGESTYIFSEDTLSSENLSHKKFSEGYSRIKTIKNSASFRELPSQRVLPSDEALQRKVDQKYSDIKLRV